MKFKHITYISVTKTGSTSIRRWFSQNMSCSYIGHKSNFIKKPFDNKSQFLDFHVHGYNFKDYQNYYNQIPNEYHEFKFTTIRNPLSKMVSGFFFCKKDKILRKISFKDFIKNINEIKHQVNIHDYNHLTLKQTEFPIHDCDYFIRQENSQKDFKKLYEICEIKHKPLVRCNTTRHKPFMDYYDEETLQLACKYLQDDFDFLPYENPIKNKIKFV